MAIFVMKTYDTYLDWVKTTDSAYKSSFESLSDRAKKRLNDFFEAVEIDPDGPWNPDNVWVNFIYDWSDKECLVDIVECLTNEEYLELVEEGTLYDYIKDEWDSISDSLKDRGFIVLDYEKDEWTIFES